MRMPSNSFYGSGLTQILQMYCHQSHSLGALLLGGSAGLLTSKFSVFEVVVLQNSANASSVLRVVSVWRLSFAML